MSPVVPFAPVGGGKGGPSFRFGTLLPSICLIKEPLLGEEYSGWGTCSVRSSLFSPSVGGSRGILVYVGTFSWPEKKIPCWGREKTQWVILCSGIEVLGFVVLCILQLRVNIV